MRRWVYCVLLGRINLKSKVMAKLIIDGVVVMLDIIENIQSVEGGLMSAGVNYQIDWCWV